MSIQTARTDLPTNILTMAVRFTVPRNGAIPSTTTLLTKKTFSYRDGDISRHRLYYDYLRTRFNIELNDDAVGMVGDFYWLPLIDQMACRRMRGSTALLTQFGTRGERCFQALVAARKAMWNEKWRSEYVPCLEITITESTEAQTRRPTHKHRH